MVTLRDAAPVPGRHRLRHLRETRPVLFRSHTSFDNDLRGRRPREITVMLVELGLVEQRHEAVIDADVEPQRTAG